MEKFDDEAKQILANIVNGSVEDPTDELVKEFIFGDTICIKVVFSGEYKDPVVPAIMHIAEDNLKLSRRVIGIVRNGMPVETCYMIGNLNVKKINQLVELSRTVLKGKIKIYISHWRELKDVLPL